MAFRPSNVRLVTFARMFALSWMLFGAERTAAQSDANGQRSWMYTAETAGMFGGRWLTGTDVPDVSGGLGGVLALGALRHVSPSTALGVVVRGSLQSVSVTELGRTWSGGTLLEGQLLGSLQWRLERGGRWKPQIDAGAGLTLLSGTQTVFPFSRAGRIAPTADIGMALGFGQQAGSYLMFARYGIVRMDPSREPGDLTEVMETSAGFVGRVTIGLRVVRE